MRIIERVGVVRRGRGRVRDHYSFLGKLPIYPSPKPALTLRAKCWLRGGVGGQFPGLSESLKNAIHKEIPSGVAC